MPVINHHDKSLHVHFKITYSSAVTGDCAYGWANLDLLCFTKRRTTIRALTTFLVQNAVNPMFDTLFKTTCTS